MSNHTLSSTANDTEQVAAATHSHKELIHSSWVTDYAWVSGVIGAAVLIGIAFWYADAHILSRGIEFLGFQITQSRQDSVLAAVIITAFVMILIELVRLYLRDPKNFIVLDPLIKQKLYQAFVYKCALIYFQNMLLFWCAIELYHAFAPTSAWDRMLDLLWATYLWGGPLYILITRACKYDPEADQKDYPSLIGKVSMWTLSLTPGVTLARPTFGLNEKKAALGLLVKLFFAPLMTQFFFNQFPTLVSNITYIMDHLPNNIAEGRYAHTTFNKDFFNIAKAFIFSVDVGLAWCGYVITSRWVDNQTKSAEPTLWGWVVCLISYPPFQMIGLYFAIPSENQILYFSNQWLITFFITLSVCCYFVYMSATLVFGVRFSNLTNRGIIRKGPYAIVRHPAYASKNIGWWCVMFPSILLNMERTGTEFAIVLTMGLVFMTWFYYQRSITEERHLSADPYYLAYCEQVKYRFIPGVI